MCKLNPRKLDHDMQFYFFRLEVANFISAQYFLNIPTYGFTYFLYQLKHTYYVLLFFSYFHILSEDLYILHIFNDSFDIMQFLFTYIQ